MQAPETGSRAGSDSPPRRGSRAPAAGADGPIWPVVWPLASAAGARSNATVKDALPHISDESDAPPAGQARAGAQSPKTRAPRDPARSPPHAFDSPNRILIG